MHETDRKKMNNAAEVYRQVSVLAGEVARLYRLGDKEKALTTAAKISKLLTEAICFSNGE